MSRSTVFVLYILFIFFCTLTVALLALGMSPEELRAILWADLTLLIGGITAGMLSFFSRRLRAWLRLRRIWKAKRSKLFLREHPLR